MRPRPRPIHLDDATDDHLSAILSGFSDSLDPFRLDAMGSGYGTDARFEGEGSRLSMHRYCWCERHDCPWCAGTISTEEGFSAHEVMEYRNTWPVLHGFVEGHGAPNFLLESGGVSVRVWWYKYIGRSMQVLGIADRHDVDALSEAFDGWIDAHRREVALRSLREWVPHVRGLAEPLRPRLLATLTARIERTPDPDLRAAIRDVARGLQDYARLQSFARARRGRPPR